MSCECGKVRYYTRKDAKQAAKTMRGSGIANGRLRSYECGGGFWHLTTESTRKTTWRREDQARAAT